MTGGVVLVTLVGQAIALPFAVRASRQLPETGVEREVSEASVVAFRSALDALPEIAARRGTSKKVTGWISEAYETFVGDARARGGRAGDAGAAKDRADYVQLSFAMIAHRRDTVIRLRDERVIDDTALRRLQAELDSEELSLVNPEPME